MELAITVFCFCSLFCLQGSQFSQFLGKKRKQSPSIAEKQPVEKDVLALCPASGNKHFLSLEQIQLDAIGLSSPSFGGLYCSVAKKDWNFKLFHLFWHLCHG